MVIAHVLPEKDTSLLDAYEKCRAIADPKTCCDYALHVGVTWWGPKVTVLSIFCQEVQEMGQPVALWLNSWLTNACPHYFSLMSKSLNAES